MTRFFFLLWMLLFTTQGAMSFGAVRIFETKPIILDGGLLQFEKKRSDLPILCSWPPIGAKALRLDKETVYKFSVFDGGFLDRHVVKIQSGETNIFDGAICDVHARKMELKRVPIIYGLLMPNHRGLGLQKFRELERTTFPNAREFRSGGCVLDSTSPKTGHLWFCKECKSAFEEWERTVANTDR